jgi:hypothetical protein
MHLWWRINWAFLEGLPKKFFKNIKCRKIFYFVIASSWTSFLLECSLSIVWRRVSCFGPLWVVGDSFWSFRVYLCIVFGGAGDSTDVELTGISVSLSLFGEIFVVSRSGLWEAPFLLETCRSSCSPSLAWAALLSWYSSSTRDRLMLDQWSDRERFIEQK